MMRKINTVIFDFDGTIADSAEIFAESLTEVLNRPALTKSEAVELSNLSFVQVTRKLGIKKWQIPSLTVKGRKKIMGKMYRVRIFPGLPEELKELAKDYELYILSSNSKSAIENFINNYKLDHYFNSVYAGTSLAGKAKRLKKLASKEQLAIASCVYIGDEVRDVEAAKQIGMKCVAVGWGYNSKNALLVAKPALFIDNPKLLVKAINSLK